MGLHMNRYIKTALLAGAAWGAISTVAVAQDAPAQTPEAAQALPQVAPGRPQFARIAVGKPVSVSFIFAFCSFPLSYRFPSRLTGDSTASTERNSDV